MNTKLENIYNECIQTLEDVPIIQEVQSTEVEKKNKQVNSLLINLSDEPGTEIRLDVEIKGILKRPLPNYITKDKANNNEFYILFAEYINSSIAQDLIASNINFVDTAGNIYLNLKNIAYIERTGKKLKEEPEKKKSMLTYPKGLQLISCILINEDLVNYTIRELASVADISTGHTSQLKGELKKNGYLAKKNKGKYKLVNKKNLFEKWLTNFGDRLRPSLLIEGYKIPSKIKSKLPEKLKSISAYAFGGVYGAYELMSYYKPKVIDIFVKEKQQMEIKGSLQMVKTMNTPDIRLFNLFSDQLMFSNNNGRHNIIHPIFIYAELLYKGSDREKETAELIYDNYLKEFLNSEE